MDFSKFKSKKVLITGHTGFKGSWLSLWLSRLGAEVTGFSDKLISNPSHYEFIKEVFKYDLRGDIRDLQNVKSVIQDYKPDFIFHLAAQPIVKDSYLNPVLTWETNLFGTINILESLKDIQKKCTAIIITSDKCYDNVEWIWGYREVDKLGGPDPYSASKGAAEIAINSYAKSFFHIPNSKVRIASARAGNVIGGGDWAANRIVPDCIRSWSKGETVYLRNPKSTRPWQHVLEPLSGYLTLALKLDLEQSFNGQAFNFGPASNETKTVLDLVEEMSKSWVKVNWKLINEKEGFHESALLKLNCDKALYFLDWQSCLSFKETMKFTVNWYKNFFEESTNVFEFSNYQIEEYTNLAKMRGIDWSCPNS